MQKCIKSWKKVILKRIISEKITISVRMINGFRLMQNKSIAMEKNGQILYSKEGLLPLEMF